MYKHDVLYAYTGENPGVNENVENSWMNFRKDGYNSLSSEGFMTRVGTGGTDSVRVYFWNVDYDGYFSDDRLGSYGPGFRPVFYLSSKAKIASGDGTKANPYILDVHNNGDLYSLFFYLNIHLFKYTSFHNKKNML